MNTLQLSIPSNQLPVASERLKISLSVFIASLLFVLGSLLHIIAYKSLIPLLPALLFFSFGKIVLFSPKIGGHFEQKIFQTAFWVNWFTTNGNRSNIRFFVLFFV